MELKDIPLTLDEEKEYEEYLRYYLSMKMPEILAKSKRITQKELDNMRFDDPSPTPAEIRAILLKFRATKESW